MSYKLILEASIVILNEVKDLIREEILLSHRERRMTICVCKS